MKQLLHMALAVILVITSQIAAHDFISQNELRSLKTNLPGKKITGSIGLKKSDAEHIIGETLYTFDGKDIRESRELLPNYWKHIEKGERGDIVLFPVATSGLVYDVVTKYKYGIVMGSTYGLDNAWHTQVQFRASPTSELQGTKTFDEYQLLQFDADKWSK